MPLAEGLTQKQYSNFIINKVNELDSQHLDSKAFSEELEKAILRQVDERSKALLRAEEEGQINSAKGSSIFTNKIEKANQKIAELRSKIDGKPVQAHLEELHQEARKPGESFFASLIRNSTRRIQLLKEKIAESSLKPENKNLSPIQADSQKEEENQHSSPMRDDLHKARAKLQQKELSTEEKIKITRDKIRLTELKLQAYRSLTKILQGHISEIEEAIKNEKDLSQEDVDKLNKFKDSLEKFTKNITTLSKEKEGLDKEQQENLKKQKIEKYKELEAKINSKRKELEAAQSAEKSAAQDQNYASFLLPGKFFEVVKQEQEEAARAKTNEIEADIKSIAADINNTAKDKDPHLESSRSAAVSAAQAGTNKVAEVNLTKDLTRLDSSPTPISTASKDEKKPPLPQENKADIIKEKSSSIEAALFGNISTSAIPSSPPAVPITEEVKQRKEQEAKKFDPTYYDKKRR